MNDPVQTRKQKMEKRLLRSRSPELLKTPGWPGKKQIKSSSNLLEGSHSLCVTHNLQPTCTLEQFKTIQSWWGGRAKLIKLSTYFNKAIQKNTFLAKSRMVKMKVNREAGKSFFFDNLSRHFEIFDSHPLPTTYCCKCEHLSRLYLLTTCSSITSW